MIFAVALRRLVAAARLLLSVARRDERLAVDVEAIWHQRADLGAGIRWLIGIIDEPLG